MVDGSRALVDWAKQGIRSLSPYQPGKPIEELQRELGIKDVVKLASNENPLGPGQKALAAVRTRLEEMSRYPDGSGYSLKRALAAHHSCAAEAITLGNGSNEVLELIARVFAGPGDEVMFSEHCFIVYPLVTKAIGANPVQVPAHDFGHDLVAMAAALTPKTRIAFIANPNNPTGTWITSEALVQFMRAVPDDCLVVVDEAYFEYAARSDYPDATMLMADYPNLMVTRTFSKVHGLASLRIGYALSSLEVADLMNRVRQPFNVNDPCMAAAEAALQDQAHLRVSVDVNKHGMEVLERGLRGLGYATIPSVANFVTFDTGTDAGPVYDKLLREGVIVRPIAGYGLPRHLRVSIGTEHENQRFLAALERVAAR
jgi:histidinol-phosphate aminotransferase